MKRIVLIIIAVLTMTTINSQTLTERQKGLAACACLMAQGDLTRLEPAVRMALDNGVTINELKEAFSQLYAYTGFPRSLNALGVLNKVLESSPSFGGSQEGGLWLAGRQALDAPCRMGRCPQSLRTGHKEPDAALRPSVQLRFLSARRLLPEVAPLW